MRYQISLITILLRFSLIECETRTSFDYERIFVNKIDNRTIEKNSEYYNRTLLEDTTTRIKLNLSVKATHLLELNVTSYHQYKALRIFTECKNCTSKNPLIITIRRRHEVVSWKLPITFPNKSNSDEGKDVAYHKVGRTLCPLVSNAEKENGNASNADQAQKLLFEEVDIYLSTNKKEVILAQLVIKFEDFELEMKRNQTTTISPSEPRYFRFNLPKKSQDGGDIYFLNASSTNHTCMILSVQGSKCPVHDLISNVKFSGDYQTVNRSGGMFITEKELIRFGGWVHIVMVALSDDSECHVNPFRTWEKVVIVDSDNESRNKTITFSITQTTNENEYGSAILGTVLGFIAFVLLVILIIVSTWGYELYKINASIKDLITRHVTRDNDHRVQYSFVYFIALLIVAIFYGIPAVQLTYANQRFTDERRNKDQCYFNFKCAHTLTIDYFGVKISDFNHFFSNIGYVIMGSLSLFCIRVHQMRRRIMLAKERGSQETIENGKHTEKYTEKETFVLKDYGLYYALAFSIIFQGIMSACYHICPNSINFQFDTIFMFAIAIITVVTMYNKLNPWQAISVFTVYGILVAFLFVSIMGVYSDAERYTKDNPHHVIFRAIASLIKLSIAFFFCYLYYTEQRIMITLAQIRKFINAIGDLLKKLKRVESHHLRGFLQPKKPKRMLVTAIWYVLNTCISFWVVFTKMNYLNVILFVLTVNTLFFLGLYFSLKIIYKERITKITTACLFLTVCFWVPAFYYFRIDIKNDEKSPANSREHNRDCSLANFYDYHDIWHFLGSVGLFLNLMVLLTLDDGLKEKLDNSDKGDFRTRGKEKQICRVCQCRPLTMRFESPDA